MRFDDRITVWQLIRRDKVLNEETLEYTYVDVTDHYGDIPAHVGSATGTSFAGAVEGLGWLTEGQAVALIEPHPQIDEVARAGRLTALYASWRDATWSVMAHLPVHRHGRPHHVTLRLKRITP